MSTPLELIFQEFNVKEEIRDAVFVHHGYISARQEILRGKEDVNYYLSSYEAMTNHKTLCNVSNGPAISLFLVSILDYQ